MKKILLYGAIAIMTWLILYCTIDIYKAPTIEGVGKTPSDDNPEGQSDPKIINYNIKPPTAVPTDIKQRFNMTSFQNLPNDNNPGGQSDPKNIKPSPAVPSDINQLGKMPSFQNLLSENRISNNPIKQDNQYMGDSDELKNSLPRINAKDIALLNRRMDGINSNNLTLDRMNRITESNSAAIDILVGATK